MPWTTQRLTTDRLILRAFTAADTDAAVVMLTDVSARLYLGGPVELPDGFSAEMIADQWGAWAITLSDTGETIGSCTFDRKRGPLELSYSLVPDAWGNGYAFEACSAVVDWVWKETDEDFIIAVTQAANAASMRLLRRMRFTEERTFEEHGARQSKQSLRRPT